MDPSHPFDYNKEKCFQSNTALQFYHSFSLLFLAFPCFYCLPSKKMVDAAEQPEQQEATVLPTALERSQNQWVVSPS